MYHIPFGGLNKKYHKDSYNTADGEDYQPPHH